VDWVFGIGHGVEFEADHGEPARAILIHELLVAWHFLFTGLTPSRPEIYEQNFAAKGSRGEFASLQVLQSELRQTGTKLTGSDDVGLRLREGRGLLTAPDESERKGTQK
jgi:hypothetical protein